MRDRDRNAPAGYVGIKGALAMTGASRRTLYYLANTCPGFAVLSHGRVWFDRAKLQAWVTPKPIVTDEEAA